MKKVLRKITKLALMGAILFAAVSSVSAYNGKYTFNLKSGVMSGWNYSSYVYKYTESENPVVSCTYTSGSTDTFEYTVFNNNNEQRVVSFTKSGTFGLRAFSRNITVKNYRYKLGIRRDGGSWYSSANAEGLWNIDSY